MARTVAKRAAQSVLIGGGGVAMTLALLGSVPTTLHPIGLDRVVSPGFGTYKALLLAVGVAIVAGTAGAMRSPASAARPVGWTERWVRVRASVGTFALLLGQLVLVTLVIRRFELVNEAFAQDIVPLVVGGFVIHALAPSPYRPAVFLTLSLCAIAIVLGPADGAWLVVVGLLLIGASHLPVAFRWRVGIVAMLGVALAASRATGTAMPWSRAMWPILGSMFMFRLIAYLYDLRHEHGSPPVSHRLSYFFLLPNVVFPLFPVVDWSSYRRTYYDADASRIYQRGIDWIVRGVLHLLLYRVVYQYLTVPPESVTTLPSLGQYTVATFLLYVRVSGQFHLVVGMLHLFGFHLPETHRRYFLASSFTDFWRRINIYWKDFMMKLVYYPAYFRLRRAGERTALVIATILVFAATWALHSYQWFWLLGRFPISWTDILFWGSLAVFLVANTLREHGRGRVRTLNAERFSGPLVVKTSATFIAICLLWSLWMSPSVTDWTAMWSRALHGSHLHDVAVMVVGVLAIVGAIGATLRLWGGVSTDVTRQPSYARATMATALPMLGVLVLASHQADRLSGGRLNETLAVLERPGLNKQDVVRLQRGYYEDLMGVSRFNSQLWEVYMRRPPAQEWPQIWETPAGRLIGGFRRQELVPGAKIDFLGSVLSVNRWGMRDRDYEQRRPPATFRFALMGASVEMGWGVNDGEPFEALTENRLNRRPPRGAARHYEILNFGIGAFKLPQQLTILDKVLSFEPEVVLLAAHAIDESETANLLSERLAAGVRPPYAYLDSVIRAVGADTLDRSASLRALEPHEDQLVGWVYREFARRCRNAGARPVWLWVPTPDRAVPADPEPLERLARAAGFEILDLTGAYRGHDVAGLRLTSFDYHPNAAGHRLLAERLYQLLVAALPRWTGDSTTR